MVNVKVTMANGEIYDALHKEKHFIISEVPKDVYKSKASYRNVPAVSSPRMQPLTHLYSRGSNNITQRCSQPTVLAEG